ncbi:hypothetical protein T08_7374 [Trichinella sp. T8]|nr:hypothetical protein T08_7374 [Trichinella sp. T8]
MFCRNFEFLFLAMKTAFGVGSLSILIHRKVAHR